jgi:hypothetical protein
MDYTILKGRNYRACSFTQHVILGRDMGLSALA